MTPPGKPTRNKFVAPRVASSLATRNKFVAPRVASSLVQHAMHDQIRERAPRMSWEKFRSEFFRWQQGQHVAFIGPTESGKTSLALGLLGHRKYVTVFATKPRDIVLDQFAQQHHFEFLKEWKSLDARDVPRRILWPDARDLYSVKIQRRQFMNAFEKIYREGNWTLYLDELWFIAKMLKLEYEVKMYLLQSRSNGISLVIATQRPAWIPLEVYDNSTWLFFWRDNDETNLKRISGISWLSKNLVQVIVANLDRFEALAINTRTGHMVRTKAPNPGLAQIGGRKVG
jgi:hypothetical protein